MYYDDFENKDNSTPEETPRVDPEPINPPEEPVYNSAPRQRPGYEPWREPVYKEAEDDIGAYSPGHYARSSYDPQRAAVQKDVKKVKVKAKKAKLGVGKTIALILVCAIIGCAAGGASAYVVTSRMPVTEPKQVIIGGDSSSAPASASASGAASSGDSSTVKNVAASDGEELSAEEIYKRACQQVVGISTNVTTNIFGMTSTSAVGGSGFIVSTDGYIVTNYHVIEYGVKYGYPVEVLTFDGTSYEATIIGYEETNDIAVIKIEAENLTPAVLGNSDAMIVGEKAYVVGNPLGELTFTMTTGIISALNRLITTEVASSVNMFQTDAAINSGNSGGPVYNSRGEVLGVVTAKPNRTSDDIGFAMPINDVKDIIADLISVGHVTGKAFLGVNSIDVEPYVSRYYNIPEGAYVTSVIAGTAAESAGINQGDVITQLGDYTVTSHDTLKASVAKYRAGDTVDVTLYRNGDYMTISVTLTEATDNS